MAEIKVHGITPRSIVIGLISLILALLLLPLTWFLSPMPNKGAWPFNIAWTYSVPDGIVARNFYFTQVLFMLFPVVFNALLPRKLRLNSWELAFVSAMMMPVTAIVGTSDGGFLAIRTATVMFGGLSTAATRDYIMKYASPLFGPKDLTLLTPMQTGGAAVPWGAWMPSIAWFTVFYMSFFSLLLFIGALIRRLWVDIEFLPFPLAAVASPIITEASADRPADTPSMFKSTYFWVGFAFALILMLLNSAQDFVKGWTSITPAYDFTPMATLTGAWVVPLNPLALGLGMFLPDAVLVTESVTYILLFMVFPWLLWVPLGFLPPLAPGTVNQLAWNRVIGKFEFYTATPLRGGYMGFGWGLILGLAVYPLVTNWRYFKGIFQGLRWRRVPGEENEAFQYRQIWLGVIVSSIVYLASLAVVNIPVHYGLIELFLVTLFWVGLMRYNAETGFGASLIGGWSEWPSMQYQFMLFPLGMAQSPEVSTPWMATTFLWTNTCWGAGGNMYTNAFSLDAFRLGSAHGSNNKHMFIALFIAVTLSVIISIPTFLWLYYWIGITPGAVGAMNNLPWYFSYRPYVEGVSHNPVFTPNASLIANYIFGFLFVFIIYYLRRHVGGIFNYASAAAILMALNQQNLWLSFIIAWVIKFATQKIGGAPLQRKITIPFGAAIFVAGCLWVPLRLGLNWLAFSLRWI